jgi:SAM-dependent methyltransferase
MTFPLQVDPDHLRGLYADLRHLGDAELLQHYNTHGKYEGRIASAASTRSGFIALMGDTGSVLEIGPFCAPAFTGDRVKYFDVLDRPQLLERAREHRLETEACPEKIHYVSPTGDLSIVDERFDIVFSSHCIEHQPDLVGHLAQVRRILGDSGRYFLAIPDKRYCFDHFIEESDVIDIVGAHLEARRVHTFRSVYNYFVRTTHNNMVAHWAGDSADPHVADQLGRAGCAVQKYKSLNGGYFDCHAWQFTPDSFRACLNTLIQHKFVAFEIERVYDTTHNSNEFYCILKSA